MIIDSSTGGLSIGKDVIWPSLRLQEFLSSSLGASARLVLRNANWATYALRLHDKDCDWGISLLFRDEVLAEIHFAPVQANESWANWSDKNEARRKIQLDGLLKASLGSSYRNLDWGEALTVSDPKSGSAYAILRYRKTQS